MRALNQMKRLNLNISPKAYNQLKCLAETTQRSMTEIIRIGLGLLKIAIEARDKGERLVIVNSNNEPIIEVLLP